MKYSESRREITSRIKEQTDIVKIIGEHVDLKKSGVRYLGLCPFHGEKTPSFSVHGAQQFFHCFGCGESGDVFSFVMKYLNMDFPAALEHLAGRLNIELPKRQMSEQEKKLQERRTLLYQVTEKACRIYHANLMQSKNGQPGREYLEQRGIPEKTRIEYKMGYAPTVESSGWDFLASQLSVKERELALETGLLAKGKRETEYDRFRDRVLFPIYDLKGRVNGFGGRIVGEGQPKYMNSPESMIYNKSRNLLGLYQQSGEIRQARSAVIVEGNFDMISLVVGGLKNVVAPLGTALTNNQIRLINRYAEEALLLFDGDEAGVKAALRTGPLFLAENMNARVALLPKGHDPDTFIREKGVAELRELLNQAVELPEFTVSQLVEQHGLSLAGKSRIIEEMKPLLTATSSPVQRSVIISHFGEKLSIDPRQLEASLAKEKIVQQTVKKDVLLKSALEERSGTKLSHAQKRLVEYMILNPRFFKDLEEKGIRTYLQGSIGEIIYLRIKEMLQEQSVIEPEEILSSLPEGPERKVVADLLLNASKMEYLQGDEEKDKNELEELIEWLEIRRLRDISEGLNKKITEAQAQNDFEALAKYLEEKQSIENRMRQSRS